jgi:hypothetical protein
VSERRRWDNDERFEGVADASALAPDIERLAAIVTKAGWVTEDPIVHLGSRCEAAAYALDLTIARLEVVDDVLEVDLQSEVEFEPLARRIAAFAVAGSIAEQSTHVRERVVEGGGVDIDVVTGILPGDIEFAPHGHVARIRFLTPA